ncbi:hypothetical protein BH10ACT10_BH10ACT10_28800 [soil metagenome]
MEFTADPAALAKAQSLVAEIAAGLVQERASLDRSVSGLLGTGWSGAAADEYRQAWGDWCDGADQVLEALHTESELLGSTRSAYLGSDDASVQTTVPISSAH